MPPKLRVGGPSPNDGPSGEVVSKSAVNIDRRLKLTVRGEGGDGTAVNIDRRLKLTANGEGGSAGNSEKGSSGGSADTPPHNDPPCCVGNLAASARSCVVAESSFAETDEATEQLSTTTYLASLSPLEQRVCSIARDHLESSFDLSRSSGFVAWVGKK
jgi:hypothetical protein